MSSDKEQAMTAREIADEIEKLIASEKAESTDESQDIKDLEDALALIEKFADHEDSEPADESKPATDAMPAKPVIDTSLVTGPLDNLKNFLVKKTRDNIQ